MQQQIHLADQQLKTVRQQLEDSLTTWVTDVSETISRKSATFPLNVVQFESQGTQDDHQILDDGSILLTSTAPDTDVYTVTANYTGDPIQITGLLLETLTHPSLPGNGPGRGGSSG